MLVWMGASLVTEIRVLDFLKASHFAIQSFELILALRETQSVDGECRS
jgi:hypothetical protein